MHNSTAKNYAVYGDSTVNNQMCQKYFAMSHNALLLGVNHLRLVAIRSTPYLIINIMQSTKLPTYPKYVNLVF